MNTPDTLYILWTNSEVETFDEMVFMYALNARIQNWWEEVTIIIWGAPASLVGKDELVQLKIKELIDKGIHVTACKACADDLGVTKLLENIGVDVRYWGNPLTEVLKSDAKLITI